MTLYEAAKRWRAVAFVLGQLPLERPRHPWGFANDHKTFSQGARLMLKPDLDPIASQQRSLRVRQAEMNLLLTSVSRLQESIRYSQKSLDAMELRDAQEKVDAMRKKFGTGESK